MDLATVVYHYTKDRITGIALPVYCQKAVKYLLSMLPIGVHGLPFPD